MPFACFMRTWLDLREMGIDKDRLSRVVACAIPQRPICTAYLRLYCRYPPVKWP